MCADHIDKYNADTLKVAALAENDHSDQTRPE